MKLKTDENGHVVVQDGKPVYVHDDGKEIAFDAPQAMAKIGELGRENRTFREGKETAEAALRAFEGLDPAKARDALDKIGNIDAGKLQNAEAVERRVAEAVKAVEAKYEPIVAERDTYKGQLDKELRGGAFARSKFAEEKVAVPRHMLERTYGDNFKIEDGKLIPYDAAGNKLFSRARPGEIADFDEALELLISNDRSFERRRRFGRREDHQAHRVRQARPLGPARQGRDRRFHGRRLTKSPAPWKGGRSPSRMAQPLGGPSAFVTSPKTLNRRPMWPTP
jgi:hypothetical protein